MEPFEKEINTHTDAEYQYWNIPPPPCHNAPQQIPVAVTQAKLQRHGLMTLPLASCVPALPDPNSSHQAQAVPEAERVRQHKGKALVECVW
jgi:hypothetical protein